MIVNYNFNENNRSFSSSVLKVRMCLFSPNLLEKQNECKWQKKNTRETIRWESVENDQAVEALCVRLISANTPLPLREALAKATESPGACNDPSRIPQKMKVGFQSSSQLLGGINSPPPPSLRHSSTLLQCRDARDVLTLFRLVS